MSPLLFKIVSPGLSTEVGTQQEISKFVELMNE